MKHISCIQRAVTILCLLLLGFQPVWAQNMQQVRGKVTAYSDGLGLPGVTIRVKSTQTGTTTDFDGNYSIEVPENGTLVFSFVGYTTEEIPVNQRSVIDVALMDDIQTLSEVVVVGYGTQKKSDLTGSVTSVTAKDFNGGFIPSPSQLITGKVAGVTITSTGGAPGSASQIRIRGGSSLNASNDPLIVVDGVPVDNSTIAGAGDPLSFINPNDIESFNILKDASATAIYGSRASNGVIIITTKKGTANQPLKANFSSMHSLSTVINQVDVLSADEYRQVINERGNESETSLLGDANTNWQDVIFQDAYSMDNNLSLSGSIAKALPFRASVGYLNQEGILKTSEFERLSGSLNLNPSFMNDHLKVNLNLKGIQSNSRFASTGAIGAALSYDPTQPIYTDNEAFGGYYQWTENDGSYETLAGANPLSILEQRDDSGEVLRSIGNLQFDYKFHFLPELRANLNLGYDLTRSEGHVIEQADYAPAVINGGTQSTYRQERTNKLLDFYLNYAKELSGIDSRIDVTGGYSYQDFLLDEPKFPLMSLTQDNEVTPAGRNIYTRNRIISFFGRANYNFKERYLLTLTLRRDGSSRFNPDNRWGTFPSAAFAWRIKEESFLQNVNAVTDLKLRVGYGVTGQQDVYNNFPYLARYTPGDPTVQYQFGSNFYTTLRPAPYDYNLKWEETATLNAGLDFGFINGRINGSLDYYIKDTKDLLSEIPVPAGTNFSNVLLTNVGTFESKGFEAVLNGVVVDNTDFGLDLGVNAFINKITITNLSKVNDSTSAGIPVGGISGGTGTTIQNHYVGYAPFSYYVYKQVYDESGRPIQNLYADLNNDGIIDEQDRYRYKSPNAELVLGFSGQARYKKLSLGFTLRGSVGHYIYNNIASMGGNYANIQPNDPTYIRNLSADIYNTGFEGTNENRVLLSDYYVQNGSFLRMENINLNYNFGKVLNKLNVGLTANVQNAFTITKYNGLDPEIAGGLDNNFYPRPRVFALGLNVGF